MSRVCGTWRISVIWTILLIVWIFPWSIWQRANRSDRSGLGQQSNLRLKTFRISAILNVKVGFVIIVSHYTIQCSIVAWPGFVFTMQSRLFSLLCWLSPPPDVSTLLSAGWWVQQIIVTLIALIGWNECGSQSLVGWHRFQVFRKLIVLGRDSYNYKIYGTLICLH